jgi:penicillin amidase
VIYESLDPSDPTRLFAEAFVAGINAYIENVVLAPGYLPPEGLEVFNIVRLNANFGPWEPADIFALARYQAYNLSYDAGADISRSARLAAVREVFPAVPPDGSPADPRYLARTGLFADFWSELPARRVYTRECTTPPCWNDGTTSAILPGGAARPRIDPGASALELPPLALLRRGEQFYDRLDRNPLFRRDPHIGSNSWVVGPALTESGNPILSNDPHLSLISPGVWWYVHLNSERMGGDLDVQGVAFAGLPGVVLGYNRDLAWSATTTGYDVTDVYQEVVTFDGTTPVSVEFEGAPVALQTVTETIRVDGMPDRTMTIYFAPHHGPLIPDTITPPETGTVGSALSVRYTGHVPTNELAFFLGLSRAATIDEALAAQENFRVGAQNFSYAARTGEIAWSTEARIPQRELCDFSINVDEGGLVEGTSPLFVLPGDGTAEWTTDLDDAFIPHEINPNRGYIATANQDNVGVTDDANPCNDGHYIGGDFDVGYRQARIAARLEAARTAETGITAEDMIALQAETKSSLGEGMRDPIVASLDRALAMPPPPDAALQTALQDAGTEGRADLADVRARLAAWTLETPHGIGASGAELADSTATTIFNVLISRLAPLAFGDEATLIGHTPGSSQTARLLEWSLMSSEEQRTLPLHTWRPEYPGPSDIYNDSVLWDDVTTDPVETRDERIVRAVLAAVAFLEEQLGTDWDEWRWGRLHAVRFAQIVPSANGNDSVSIPPERSTEFPIGFPRHGDFGAVDVGNFGLWNTTSFTHGSGASQRLVVEMTDEGPVAFNALPGGQSEDIASPHHADEAELWRQNQQPPLYFERADVEAHAESVLIFRP